jgi:hypothetical protein
MKYAYNILLGKLEGKLQLERRKRKWAYNIEAGVN